MNDSGYVDQFCELVDRNFVFEKWGLTTVRSEALFADSDENGQERTPTLCPGLVLVAVNGKYMADTKIEESDTPDINTLACVVFRTRGDRWRFVHGLDRPLVQFFLTATVGSPSHAQAYPLENDIRMRGKFVVSIAFGRPRTRELIMSKDRLSSTREKGDSTKVKADLCLRKDIELVPIHPLRAVEASQCTWLHHPLLEN